MDIIEIRPLSKKWFTTATPVNFVPATAEIGSGDNGTITISADDLLASSDVVEIVLADGADEDMSVVYANGTITVTLGTDGDELADDTKNTAELIAEAISEIDGFTAVASGTGETAIDTATSSDVEFEDGTEGTPCPKIGTCLYNSANGTYYVNTIANNTIKNTGWRTFSLTTY